jgi:outer membrane protein
MRKTMFIIESINRLRHLLPLFAAAALRAAPIAAAEPLQLTLEQSIDLALNNNLQLRSARVRADESASAVAVESAHFGRTLEAGLSRDNTRSPSVSALEQVDTSTSDAFDLSIGAKQQLRSGGQLSLVLNSNRASTNAAYRTIDPVYRSDIALNFTQPLLQGRGHINSYHIELARNAEDAAQLDVQQSARDIRAAVGSAYWQLHYARSELEVVEQLFAGAQRVLETVRTREAMGTGTQSAILEAEVELVRREGEVVATRSAMRDAEEELRAICALDIDERSWDRELIPGDTPINPAALPDLAQGLRGALAASPEFKSAALQQKDLDLQIEWAADQTRLALDLHTRIGVNGIGASSGDHLDLLRQGEGRSLQVGLTFALPLGASTEQARLRQRQLQKQRAEIDSEALRRQISRQVRDQHRRVQTSVQASAVAESATSLAARRVREEEDRLNLGLTTVRQVLDAQDELARARLSQQQAVLSYNKALLEWKRLTALEAI